MRLRAKYKIQPRRLLGILFHFGDGGSQSSAMVVIVGAIAELERSLIVERVKAGMRRAKLEGRRIGRAPLNVDRAAIVRDRLAGLSLTEVANRHRVSVCRLVIASINTPLIEDEDIENRESALRKPTCEVIHVGRCPVSYEGHSSVA